MFFFFLNNALSNSNMVLYYSNMVLYCNSYIITQQHIHRPTATHSLTDSNRFNSPANHVIFWFSNFLTWSSVILIWSSIILTWSSTVIAILLHSNTFTDPQQHIH